MNTQISNSRGQSGQEIVFQCDCGFAKKVVLEGSFTGGHKAPILMRRNPHGSWETKVFLEPGRYHYKFLVEGAPQDDPSIASCPLNPFGASDHLLEIS